MYLTVCWMFCATPSPCATPSHALGANIGWPPEPTAGSVNTQHHRPFRCIDEYDECVRKQKKQKKSPYLCSVALFICLANSMKVLLAAIAAAAKAGGHLS